VTPDLDVRIDRVVVTGPPGPGFADAVAAEVRAALRAAGAAMPDGVGPEVGSAVADAVRGAGGLP
jgi:hypothetical protein